MERSDVPLLQAVSCMAAARLAAALCAMLSMAAQADAQPMRERVEALPGPAVEQDADTRAAGHLASAPPLFPADRVLQKTADVTMDTAAAPAAARLRFDLPGQPLDDALQAFSRQTGWSLLYDTAQVAGRRVGPLRGEFTVPEAIARLLAGSGMTARFTSSEALLIVPEAQAGGRTGMSATGNARQAGPRGDYYGRLQLRVTQALCGDPLTAPGRYRVALRFDIGPLNTLENLQVHVSGHPDVEARVRARLAGLPVGGKPPADLRMPVTMVVLPEAGADDATRSCGS